MGSILFLCGLTLLLITLLLFVLLHNEKHRHQEQIIRQERQSEEVHRQELELPEGPIIYRHQPGQDEYIATTLHPLTGNPDYVVELEDGRLLPMEHKPSVNNIDAPHSYHALQVAADCLLLEEHSEHTPTHGLLRYADRTFTVEYTPTLRRKVLRVLNEMSQFDEDKSPQILKQRASRCRACTFKPICPIGRDK